MKALSGYHDKDLPDFPAIINLEVFRGACPCRCVHCPVGIVEPRLREARFGSGRMSIELFRKITEEIAEHREAVLRIHATGEPLLWDNLPEALSILQHSKVITWLFTSGFSQDESLFAEICRSLQVVEVSVNSVSREDYRLTKGIDAFEHVAGNIRLIKENIKGHNPVRLIVSRVESDDREADDSFIAYWKKSGLVDDAFVRSKHTYNNLLGSSCDNDSEPDTKPVFRHEPCLVHWGRFNISVDGKAVVCFNELFKPDLPQGLVYGDLHESSIKSLWKDKKIQAIRSAELSGDYNNPLIDDHLPCKDCQYCQPLFGKEGKQTSEFQILMHRQATDAGEEEGLLC